AVCAAGARHRQARQLRARPPRADAVGGTPAIEVSAQPGRELASTDPAPRAGDEAVHRARHAQRFLSVFSRISPHFRPRRHLLSATGWRHEMADRFTAWNQITGVTRPPPERELGQSFHQNLRTTRERQTPITKPTN